MNLIYLLPFNSYAETSAVATSNAAGTYNTSNSSNSKLKVSFLTGLCQASVTSSNSISQIEGPAGLSFVLDYIWSPNLSLGAVHTRTVSGSASSVGLTGLQFKYYFLNSQADWLEDYSSTQQNLYTKTFIQFRGFYPFLTAGWGFAQASILGITSSQDILSYGVYGAGGFGLDFPLKSRWSVRGEYTYGQTLFGTGKVAYYYALIGLNAFF